MEAPFKAPPISTLDINYKYYAFSKKIKKTKIKRIDGKKVCSFKYKYTKGVLTSKKVKSKNPDKNEYADGVFHFSETDSSLLLVKYRLIESTISEYNVSHRTKVFENNELADQSSESYSVDTKLLLDALPDMSTLNSQPNTQSNSLSNSLYLPIGGNIGCSSFYNWYSGPFTNITQEFNDSGQLLQRTYVHNGVQQAYIRYYYNDNKISQVMLFQNGSLTEQVLLFYDGNGNLSSFQRVN
jgi:hypothetical protein